MWPNPQFTADLVTFTEEILNGKLRLLCSEMRLSLSSFDIAKQSHWTKATPQLLCEMWSFVKQQEHQRGGDRRKIRTNILTMKFPEPRRWLNHREEDKPKLVYVIRMKRTNVHGINSFPPKAIVVNPIQAVPKMRNSDNVRTF